MPTIDDRLHVLARERCIPLTAAIEITLRCNLRCVHCYNFDRAEEYAPHRRRAELTPGEILGVVDDLHALGCLHLSFTGGEATGHPHLFDFIGRARERRMTVSLLTNGVTLTPDLARRLADAEVGGMSISLYGGTAATHDAVTAVPGSFDRTVAGAAAARDAGIDVVLKCILFASTVHEAGAMIGIAERLGVGHQIDTEITGRYDGTRGPLGRRLTPAQLEALYRDPRVRDGVLAATTPVAGKSSQCNCARSRAAVSAYGDVYPCIAAPLPAGNVRERPLAEIWRTSPVLQWIRGLRQEDFQSCTPCPHRDWCRRSSGTVYVNTGDYTGLDRWTCDEAEILHRLHDERTLAAAGESSVRTRGFVV